MTDENAIKYLKQLYTNGGHCWLDEQRIDAISIAINAIEFKEKVRAEIERLRKSFKVISVASPSKDTTLENIAKAALCKQILSFIDSIQEEPIIKETNMYIFITQRIVDYIEEHKVFFENTIPTIGEKWFIEREHTYPNVNRGNPVVEVINDKGEWMRLPKDIVEIFEEPKDKCKGCNNVKGCITCVDGSEWAHYEEPVSEDLEEASKEWLRPQLDKSYANYGEVNMMELTHFDGYAMLDAIEFGAKWKVENLWKPADGDDLPIFDRDVIALEGIIDPTATDCFCGYKVVFAHRPTPEGYDGKSIATGVAEHYTPETYGEGGWNVPNIAYWLDIELPKEIEL